MNTENLRLGIEHSRSRFGLTEMVLTCDEVEELCDEIDRLKKAQVELTDAWLMGDATFTDCALSVSKGMLRIGVPKYSDWRAWWSILKWMVQLQREYHIPTVRGTMLTYRRGDNAPPLTMGDADATGGSRFYGDTEDDQ